MGALLIQLIVLCLVLGLVIYIFRVVPILQPFQWLAQLICVVIAVVWLIDVILGVGGGVGFPALHRW